MDQDQYNLHKTSNNLFESSPPLSTAHPVPPNLNPNSTTDSWKRQRRTPLAHVVSDCVRRWFEDALKEAKSGDTAMQVLVGQMYSSGYGIAKDAHKGRAWINRASRSRSSVWKVGDKHPGYNASDSDSDDSKQVSNS